MSVKGIHPALATIRHSVDYATTGAFTMETTQIVWIGKNERNVVEAAIRHFGGVLVNLSRKEIVGSPESVILFTSILDSALESRCGNEERIARENFSDYQNRGIRVTKYQVCEQLRTAQEDLAKFRGRLEEARAADQKWKAEQDAAKAANVATSAPAEQVVESTGTEG